MICAWLRRRKLARLHATQAEQRVLRRWIGLTVNENDPPFLRLPTEAERLQRHYEWRRRRWAEERDKHFREEKRRRKHTIRRARALAGKSAASGEVPR